MDNIEKTTAYIKATLGLPCKLDPFSVPGLPFFLNDSYRFYRAELLGLPWLLMWDRSGEGSPAAIEKHYLALQQHWPKGEVVYGVDTMTAQNRRRLIQHKVPFIVPDNQMYLPMLGIELREHFRKRRSGARAGKEDVLLSPTAQLVVLWALLKEPVNGINSAQMAERLQCTRMAAARAYDELMGFDWTEIKKTSGNQKALILKKTGHKLWKQVQPFMQSPVRKERWVLGANKTLPAVLAGESALAKYTLMGEPTYPVYAIAASEWMEMKKKWQWQEIQNPEPGCIALQTWRYAPELLAAQGCVDRLSLFLSLQQEADPRVSKAADELLEQMSW